MIPNIAYWHPPIAHFVVALLIVGVILRLISLSGRLAFTGPAAALLLLAGTGAAVVAVQSGTDAHGPVERIPGVRNAVAVHEDAGHDTRNVFLVVAALELADAYVAAGVPDSARATLEALSQAYPNNARIKQRLEQLKK
jgi:uncharacterized membrane protein